MAKKQKFICDQCSKEFKREYNLKNHKEVVHSDIVSKYVCYLWPRCKKFHLTDSFYCSMSSLRVHFLRHHKKSKFNEKKVQKQYVNKTSKAVQIISGFTVHFMFLCFIARLPVPNSEMQQLDHENTTENADGNRSSTAPQSSLPVETEQLNQFNGVTGDSNANGHSSILQSSSPSNETEQLSYSNDDETIVEDTSGNGQSIVQETSSSDEIERLNGDTDGVVDFMENVYENIPSLPVESDGIRQVNQMYLNQYFVQSGRKITQKFFKENQYKTF